MRRWKEEKEEVNAPAVAGEKMTFHTLERPRYKQMDMFRVQCFPDSFSAFQLHVNSLLSQSLICEHTLPHLYPLRHGPGLLDPPDIPLYPLLS